MGMKKFTLTLAIFNQKNKFACLVFQEHWIKFDEISLSVPKCVLVLINLCPNRASVLLSGCCIHIHQDKNLILDEKVSKIEDSQEP